MLAEPKVTIYVFTCQLVMARTQICLFSYNPFSVSKLLDFLFTTNITWLLIIPQKLHSNNVNTQTTKCKESSIKDLGKYIY